jgi:23S rRNA pseudouridine2605 synthase
MPSERLQKILARAGVASRRASERLIQSGRVRVNGRVVTELGAKADAHADRVEVDGKRVVLEPLATYLAHKPRGMVTTLSDPEGRPHLGQLLTKIPQRVYPVGRLDYHTSGALLVTNDGKLTEALLHPRRSVPKVYVAKVRGHPEVEALDRLRNGVRLDDGTLTKKAEVFVLRDEGAMSWLQLTLTEGKNRQVHRMCEAVGHPVLRLARTSFAGLDTEGLRPGQLRPLSKKELDKLKKRYLRGATSPGDPASKEPS